MRRSLQTETGQRLRESRKRFKLKPVGKKTQANRQKLRNARASRVKSNRAKGYYTGNPFSEGGIV